MRPWFFIIVFCLLFSGVKSQNFHESLDLHYNLRPSLVEDQKAKIGFRTYSNVNFENTIPNILDNFQLLSRFKFPKTSSSFVKNAEFGGGITWFYSGSGQVPDQIKKPPLYIRLYNNQGNNYIITPGIQYIKSWIPNDSIDKRFQFGLSFRYNIIGDPESFSKTYPFGYDFSFQVTKKFFSFQFMHSANTIYNSLTFKTSDFPAFSESKKDRISFPTEFENLTFLTFSLGNPCYQMPSESDPLLHYLYFSMRRLYPSNKDYRAELSLKNLDYIFGINIRYKQLLINPEFTTRRDYFEYYTAKGKCYSLLFGYSFNRMSIKLGYSHVVYYVLATDLLSLQNDDYVHLDKIILALDYSF